MDNFLFMADSYKYSHWPQYPLGTDGYYGYIEARGCERTWKKSVFFGLQIFRNKYLTKPITQADIDEAAAFAELHGEPFNRKGWEYILKKYNGYIPVTIKAAPEGTVIDLSLPLVTVQCLDPECFWVGSFIETALLRAVWYPITVATLSWHCKQIIKEEMEKSCDNTDGLIFKLHDFGGRGVSSSESAQIGGAAHLVNFFGSDTIEGIVCANRNYNIAMAGFSIPAAEHSTITSWGKEYEVEAYRNMIKQYGQPGKLFAVVSDSYNIYNACEKLWGEELKQEVIDSGAILIVRPDSGDPEEVTLKCVEILGKKFGYTVNTKGFKVLNHVRLIQGDGVNERSIKNILANFRIHNWSAENIAFGMGGALLQGINRDTLQFAMKCCALRINGEWHPVSKDPITDSGKRSKGGRISTYVKGHGGKPEYVFADSDELTSRENWEEKKVWMPELLEVVYQMEEGFTVPYNRQYTFEEVRARSNQ